MRPHEGAQGGEDGERSPDSPSVSVLLAKAVATAGGDRAGFTGHLPNDCLPFWEMELEVSPDGEDKDNGEDGVDAVDLQSRPLRYAAAPVSGRTNTSLFYRVRVVGAAGAGVGGGAGGGGCA